MYVAYSKQGPPAKLNVKYDGGKCIISDCDFTLPKPLYTLARTSLRPDTYSRPPLDVYKRQS